MPRYIMGRESVMMLCGKAEERLLRIPLLSPKRKTMAFPKSKS
jgi:hypothetical protein